MKNMYLALMSFDVAGAIIPPYGPINLILAMFAVVMFLAYVDEKKFNG